MKILSYTIAASIAILVLAFTYQADAQTVLFQETFSDGSVGTPVDLNGSTPDVTTGGATWTASEWQENGSTTTIATSGGAGDDDSAFLAFTPSAGFEYTLSATMTVPSGGQSTGWVALGFADTNTTTGSFWENGTAPWVLYRPDSNVDTFAESLGTAPNFDLGVATNSEDEGNFATSADFAIVLDTTASAWTAEWFINGSSVRGPVTYATNPSINYVGIGRDGGVASNIDNFSLTAVPEPSAALLLGFAGLLLLRRRR